MKNIFGSEIVRNKLIDRNLLASVIEHQMKGISEQELISMIYSKYEAIIDFSRLCNNEKAGYNISLLFNPHRYSTRTKNSISILDAFQQDNNFLSGLARATLFKINRYKDWNLLDEILRLGVNGIQYVNEFPPYIARDFYKSFSARRILDPCAGWGGRMIGAASVGSFYHGFEPAKKTFLGLLKLGDFLKKFNTGFDFKIENICFEDAKIKENYDFALTSPPYYDTEIYSEEKTQSCNRYGSFKEWCEKFYIPLCEKTIKKTKSFVINIGSRKYDLKGVLLEAFPETKEVRSYQKFFMGSKGLGKKENGKEAFYLVMK